MPEEQWKEVDKFEPRYNIQPGANALVVVKDGEVRLAIEQMSQASLSNLVSIEKQQREPLHSACAAFRFFALMCRARRPYKP